MSCFVESPGSNEGKSSGLITTVQVPENPSVLIKISLSEIKNMEIDENSSSKKTKIFSQDDQSSSEIISEELKKIVLIPKNSVQMDQFSFGSENSAEPSLVFRSKAKFMTCYVEKQMQSLEETKNLLP